VVIDDGPFDVVFYVKKDVNIEEGSDITARIYTLAKLIVEKAESDNPTYMTGLFIAEKVVAKEHVFWNWDPDYCPLFAPVQPLMAENPGPVFTTPEKIKNDILGEGDGIRLYPNPTVGGFTIELNTIVESEVNIDIIDANGQLVFQDVCEPFSNLMKIDFQSLGLSAGVYLVRLTERNKVVVKKLVLQGL
jgi:hypothetical protein